jgi:hypothetical protein
LHPPCFPKNTEEAPALGIQGECSDSSCPRQILHWLIPKRKQKTQVSSPSQYSLSEMQSTDSSGKIMQLNIDGISSTLRNSHSTTRNCHLIIYVSLKISIKHKQTKIAQIKKSNI